MKWFIVTTLLIATIIYASASKSNEKISKPIKKANSVKPTKYPKSLLDEFSGLTEDDTKFIKELDKQFKVHGDQIKIKIKKENTTTTKNSKRTIDGALGYGYQQPQHLQQGFHFSPPKFMIYPYSQHDILPPPRFSQNQPHGGFIPSNGPGGRYSAPQSDLHTSIRDGDQQRPNNFGDNRGPQLFPQQQIQQQQQPVPVIVLRIPGPPQYANHLQALLQRYLELRAAQYINELQQQEQQNLQFTATPQPPQFSGPRYLPKGPGPLPQQPQRIIPVHQTQSGFITPGPIGPIPQQVYSTTAASYTDANVGVYPSQTIYEDHQIVSPQPIRQRPQVQQFQHIHQLQHFQQIQNIQEQQRLQYIQQIRHQQQLQAQQQHILQQQQQQQEDGREEHLSANQQEELRQQQQSAYEHSFPRDQPEDEEEGQGEPQQQFTYDRQPQIVHQVEHQDEPPLNENYPGEHHTQVILPQQRIPVVHQYHQEVTQFRPQPQQLVQESTPGPYNYQAPDEDQQLQYNQQVDITPKPPQLPYNYHAHPIPPIPERRRDAPYSQDQFRKYTNVINRLKKKKPAKPIVVAEQDE